MPPRLLDSPIDVLELLKDIAAPGHGATVLFVGTVRNQHDGRPVRAIDYTAYRVMAEERLRTIERELAAAHGARVRLAHRDLDEGARRTIAIVRVESELLNLKILVYPSIRRIVELHHVGGL